MWIPDNWEIIDRVSGLKIQVRHGKNFNHLHIEFQDERIADNRDFYFTPNGEFDGTGSVCNNACPTTLVER